jgi:transcriptional regulator with XRE-family HTH domain
MPGIHLPQRIVDGDFGGWLRDAMRVRRLSTRAVAMRTGVDHTTISRLMRNAREPVLSTAIRLLHLLGRDHAAAPPAASPAAPEDAGPKKAA